MWRDIFRYLGVELGQVTAYLAWAPFILAAGILGFSITEGVPWVWKKIRARRAPKALSSEAQTSLERCQKGIADYVRIAASESVSGHETLGAWWAFRPDLTELSRILYEQEIPHPEIESSVGLNNAGEWSRFMATLWAVRHDVEAARRVYREG